VVNVGMVNGDGVGAYAIYLFTCIKLMLLLSMLYAIVKLPASSLVMSLGKALNGIASIFEWLDW